MGVPPPVRLGLAFFRSGFHGLDFKVALRKVENTSQPGCSLHVCPPIGVRNEVWLGLFGVPGVRAGPLRA